MTDLDRLYWWCRTHEIAHVRLLPDAVELGIDVVDMADPANDHVERILVRTMDEARTALGY